MKKRIIFLVLAVALCLSLAVNVLAFTDTVKMLEAHFSGIKIVLDGVEITPKDATGKVVEPFIVDGTTYLPVRAVAEAFGKEVAWDGETRTVSLGKPADLAPWADLNPYTNSTNLTKIYDGSDPKASFTAAGTEHKHGVTIKRASSSGGNANLIWNTNGLYKSMTFTIASLCTYKIDDVTMKVKLGDVEYQTYTLHWNDAPRQITIPVNYASNVSFSLGFLYNGCGYAMYDISFEK